MAAVVLAQHSVLVLLVSAWLVSASHARLRASLRAKLSALVFGAGSAALVTTVFC